MTFTKSLSTFFLIYFAHITHCQPEIKFFRKDYKYFEEINAFYKIHTLTRTWQGAKDKCEMEGAQLFYASEAEEATTVIRHWNETQPYIQFVFVGISTPFVKEVFETIDGRPLLDIYNNWGPGEPNNANNNEGCVVMRRDGTLNDDNCMKKFAFICKKTRETLLWNNYCDMPDMNYQYNAQLGRCYKFHLNPMGWEEAYAVCDSEQSYLAVINTQEEADHLAEVTANAPKDSVTGSYLRGAVHLGFKKVEQEWKTIKGDTLEKSGYSKWGGGQPDGGDQELCGSMFYNGNLNDISCDRSMFFICEHEISLLSIAYTLRSGDASNT